MRVIVLILIILRRGVIDMILIGRVRWFDNAKGYGFITTKDGKDVFVHYTAIMCENFRSLEDGQLVCYRIVRGKRGLMAQNVIPLSSSGTRMPTRFH